MATTRRQPRLLNLTPHAIHIECGADPEPLVIPSDGELRLKTQIPAGTLSHLHPLHYYRESDKVEAAISIVHAQVFSGLDETSPGYKHLASLTRDDSVVVSMPIAQWITKYMKPGGCFPWNVLSLHYGDVQSDKKGQTKIVCALEYHETPS